jgi:hypothetical protein
MYNIDSRLREFYAEEVVIGADIRKKLHEARVANEGRLESGLKKAEKPAPKRHVKQGSYAMKTVVQQPNNAYDIDNGALFDKAKLIGPNGGEMTPLEARTMVCDGLQDASFKKKPEVRPHCVRVHYNEGWWVDVPVYREVIEGKVTRLELASSAWKASNPEGVTAWFDALVKSKSPDADKAGDPQFRRVVSYVKGLAKTRTSWNWPTGFMISVLVSETYVSDERDDVSLRKTLKAIVKRLEGSLRIDHPVLAGERLDRGDDDSRCVDMRDKLKDLMGNLDVLDDPKCSAEQAAKAWDTLYGVSFFRDRIKGGGTSAVAAATPTAAVERGTGGRYG